MKDIIKILSSNGILKIVAATGQVISCEEYPDSMGDLSGIFLFDMDEWREHYPQFSPPSAFGITEIDILDIGFHYITESGQQSYEPPSSNYRGISQDVGPEQGVQASQV